MKKLSYVNKRGRTVEVTVTRHAMRQLLERWFALHGEELKDPDGWILENFSRSNLVKNLTRIEQERIKKYKGNTMFFRTHGFTFVVSDAKIVTIEISNRDNRALNKLTKEERDEL